MRRYFCVTNSMTIKYNREITYYCTSYATAAPPHPPPFPTHSTDGQNKSKKWSKPEIYIYYDGIRYYSRSSVSTPANTTGAECWRCNTHAILLRAAINGRLDSQMINGMLNAIPPRKPDRQHQPKFCSFNNAYYFEVFHFRDYGFSCYARKTNARPEYVPILNGTEGRAR